MVIQPADGRVRSCWLEKAGERAMDDEVAPGAGAVGADVTPGACAAGAGGVVDAVAFNVCTAMSSTDATIVQANRNILYRTFRCPGARTPAPGQYG